MYILSVVVLDSRDHKVLDFTKLTFSSRKEVIACIIRMHGVLHI